MNDIKGLLIIAFWLYLVATCFLRIHSVLWFISVLLNFAVACEVALFHSVKFADTTAQLSRTAIFFMVLCIGVFIARSDAIKALRLDSLILWIAVIAAGFKIGILAVAGLGHIRLETILDTLGFESVTLDLGLGFYRLQFPSDIVLVFLTACYTGGRNKAIDLLMMFCVTVAVFLSFSRYLFVAYLCSLLLRGIRLRRFDTVSYAAIVIGTVFITVFFITLVDRFTGTGSTVSDSIRTYQIVKLSEVISKNQLLGTGLGSSVPGFLRSFGTPYFYEVQWYALTMQFGFLGLAWFCANLIAPLAVFVQSKASKIFAGLLFAIWAISGFTNPFVTSLGSAFGFCFLMLRLAQSPGRAQLATRAVGAPA